VPNLEAFRDSDTIQLICGGDLQKAGLFGWDTSDGGLAQGFNVLPPFTIPPNGQLFCVASVKGPPTDRMQVYVDTVATQAAAGVPAPVNLPLIDWEIRQGTQMGVTIAVQYKSKFGWAPGPQIQVAGRFVRRWEIWASIDPTQFIPQNLAPFGAQVRMRMLIDRGHGLTSTLQVLPVPSQVAIKAIDPP
jgi:hypothetical protein